jgi:hypothetical protein
MKRAGITKRIVHETENNGSKRYDKGLHTSFRKRFRTPSGKHGREDIREELLGHRDFSRHDDKAYYDPDSISEEDILEEYPKFNVRIFETESDKLNVAYKDGMEEVDKKLKDFGVKQEPSNLPNLRVGEGERRSDTGDSSGSHAENRLDFLSYKGDPRFDGLSYDDIEGLPEPYRSEALDDYFDRIYHEVIKDDILRTTKERQEQKDTKFMRKKKTVKIFI